MKKKLELENDTRELNKMSCILAIETDLDPPSTITDITGIKATDILIKGSQWYTASTKKAIPGKVHEYNLWKLEPEVLYGNDNTFLNHAVERIIKILDTKEKEFKEIFNKYPKSNLRCYAYYYEVNPYFHFTKEILSKLASYNLGIDFDIYCLARDEKESDVKW